jgi:hypothetical protein
LKNRRAEQVLPWVVGTIGRGRRWGNGVGEYGAKNVYIYM